MNERDKELAIEAGMVYRKFEDEFANANTDGVDQKTMQQFADLIRADEREVILKLADSLGWVNVDHIQARGNI